MRATTATQPPNLTTPETVKPSRTPARFARWLDQRIPPTRQITLSQANIFIFPTRYGFVFGGLLVVLILGAINYQNSLVFGVVFLLGSLFTVTILHTFRNLSGIQLEFVDARPGFVDEEIEFCVRVTRPKHRGREGIQIGWPEGIKRWVEIFEAEAQSVRLYVRGTARGRLQPGRLLVETHFPLGLVRAWTWVDLNAQALVYPKPIFTDVPDVSQSKRDDGELVDPLGSDDFTDIKSYQAGDPVKHILWRSFARSDQLMVKRYASYIEPRLWFDFAEVGGNTEERLSKLAGWALRATRAEREFGLRLPSREVRPGVGEAHLEAVLRELALYGID